MNFIGRGTPTTARNTRIPEAMLMKKSQEEGIFKLKQPEMDQRDSQSTSFLQLKHSYLAEFRNAKAAVLTAGKNRLLESQCEGTSTRSKTDATGKYELYHHNMYTGTDLKKFLTMSVNSKSHFGLLRQ